MTLCIAWKQFNKISVCSDSRISTGVGHADVAIKIMSVPVRIGGPMNVRTELQRDVVYEKNIGICFAGNGTLSSYILKEYLQHSIKLVQFVPGKTDIRFIAIVEYINKILKYVANELLNMFYMLESEFLFMGLCPHENVLKCFKVSLNTVDGKAELSTTEELVNNNTTIFLGSGSNRAKNILLAHKTNSLNDYLKTLKEVINDPNVPGVGGLIQFGDFDDHLSFRLLPILDFEEIDEDIHLFYSYRGLNFEKAGLNFRDRTQLRFLPGFISPFQKEIEVFKESGKKVLVKKEEDY